MILKSFLLLVVTAQEVKELRLTVKREINPLCHSELSPVLLPPRLSHAKMDAWAEFEHRLNTEKRYSISLDAVG
jgi:hypothetical protein